MDIEANDLFPSLSTSIGELKEIQERRASVAQLRADALQEIHKQSRLTTEQNKKAEQMHLTQQQLINAQRTDCQALMAQMQQTFEDQLNRIGQKAINTDVLKVITKQCVKKTGNDMFARPHPKESG